MREITRTETAGLIGLLIIISGVVGWTSLHSVLSPTPIIFKQASHSIELNSLIMVHLIF